ncbi:MAG: T9SS type A sorting domain-containing protein, partial [Flavobacteriales bacterium]|nr:T9SS type A sorting domain-containing protein [Flavobacteriales bacterium]
GSAVGGWNTITYTVTSGLCPGTATDSVYVSTVGIADMAVPGTMSVWPVPARNELFISLPAGSTDVLLTLVDADGREVARRTVSGGTTQAPLRWDIGSLANGSYALWTTGRGNMAPARVVIAH